MNSKQAASKAPYGSACPMTLNALKQLWRVALVRTPCAEKGGWLADPRGVDMAGNNQWVHCPGPASAASLLSYP